MPRELSVAEQDDGTCLQLVPGDALTVSLDDNPSGGYRWQLTVVQGAAVRIVDEGYEPRSAAVGSGGRAWWTLKAETAGAAELQARRSRAWQPTVEDARWHLSVTVTPHTR